MTPSIEALMRKFKKDKAQHTEGQELITCGCYTLGNQIFLCPPDDDNKARTIKIITIPLSLYRQYTSAHVEWSKVQQRLDSFPQALRERKKSVRRSGAGATDALFPEGLR